MSKYTKATVVGLFIVLNLVFAKPVHANDTLDDYYKTLEKLKNEQEEQEKKKAEKSEEKEAVKREIAALENEQVQIAVEIQETQANIEVKKEEIEVTKVQIGETELTIEQRNEELENILRYFQKSRGFSQYLKFLFGASDLDDLARRFYAVRRLSEYNDQIIHEMEDLLVQLNEQKEDLARQKVELEEHEVELEVRKEKLFANIKAMEAKMISIGSDIKALNELGEDYDMQIKTTEAVIKQFEDDGCTRYEKLSQCSVTVIESDRFYSPVKGGKITSNFGPRCFTLSGRWYCDYHSGLDISYGYNSVYAAAGGKVSYVCNDPYSLTPGGNCVILNHIINGVKYTTAYYHLGSVSVKAGATVTAADKIGTIGNTGYATTGAHLHFTVTYNWRYGTGAGSYSTYADYKKNYFDPRKVISFPSKGVYWEDSDRVFN